MGSNITFTKAPTAAVTIDTTSVAEEYKNKLITIALSTTSPNQAGGAKETKIIDLLRITTQYVIKAYIVAESGLTAKEKKDRLKLIATGSGTDGGVITMTYDGDSIEGYIESITFLDESNDYPTSENTELARYTLTITFVKGTA